MSSATQTRPDRASSPDFASDDKENKEKGAHDAKSAWSPAINGDYMTKLGEEKAPTVGCETCHHGAKEPPEPLANMMTSTATAKGVPAAASRSA